MDLNFMTVSSESARSENLFVRVGRSITPAAR
jgi:hypothetical protein